VGGKSFSACCQFMHQRRPSQGNQKGIKFQCSVPDLFHTKGSVKSAVIEFLVIVNDRPSVKMVFSLTLSFIKIFSLLHVLLLLWGHKVGE